MSADRILDYYGSRSEKGRYRSRVTRAIDSRRLNGLIIGSAVAAVLGAIGGMWYGSYHPEFAHRFGWDRSSDIGRISPEPASVSFPVVAAESTVVPGTYAQDLQRQLAAPIVFLPRSGSGPGS